jgi:hypothetical protein
MCQQAERAILDAAGRMDADRELTEMPVSFQDTSHRIELELYQVPEKYRAQAPAGTRPAPDSSFASPASLADGHAEDSIVGTPRNWLPRALISAFMSTILMSIIFFVAFAFARIGATVIPDAGPASVLHDWLVALTTNSVLDLAASSLYVAGALHIVIGTVWGLIYAVAFEPRLSGPSWLKGAAFGLLPWVLSLLVFLPLVGGGVFGAAIGAGPLPALGNLILHLVYGVSLGALYGPLGEIPADQFPRTTASNAAWKVNEEEAAMAKGVIGGAIVGGLLGIMGALVASASPSGSLYGAEPMAILAVSVVLGAAFGLFAGSIAGLESTGA